MHGETRGVEISGMVVTHPHSKGISRRQSRNVVQLPTLQRSARNTSQRFAKREVVGPVKRQIVFRVKCGQTAIARAIVPIQVVLDDVAEILRVYPTRIVDRARENVYDVCARRPCEKRFTALSCS